jgi:hypothetical protein
MDWIHLAQDRDQWKDFSEHGDELSGSIKCSEIPEPPNHISKLCTSQLIHIIKIPLPFSQTTASLPCFGLRISENI